jgi:hypothetical protein
MLPITERPRVLYLPLREELTLAFLEYIYIDSLHPKVDVPSACALPSLSKRYGPGLERLGELAADIMHRGLNEDNAWQVIEAAAYAGRNSALPTDTALTFRFERWFLSPKEHEFADCGSRNVCRWGISLNEIGDLCFKAERKRDATIAIVDCSCWHEIKCVNVGLKDLTIVARHKTSVLKSMGRVYTVLKTC